MIQDISLLKILLLSNISLTLVIKKITLFRRLNNTNIIRRTNNQYL